MRPQLQVAISDDDKAIADLDKLGRQIMKLVHKEDFLSYRKAYYQITGKAGDIEDIVKMAVEVSEKVRNGEL